MFIFGGGGGGKSSSEPQQLCSSKLIPWSLTWIPLIPELTSMLGSMSWFSRGHLQYVHTFLEFNNSKYRLDLLDLLESRIHRWISVGMLIYIHPECRVSYFQPLLGTGKGAVEVGGKLTPSVDMVIDSDTNP